MLTSQFLNFAITLFLVGVRSDFFLLQGDKLDQKATPGKGAVKLGAPVLLLGQEAAGSRTISFTARLNEAK